MPMYCTSSHLHPFALSSLLQHPLEHHDTVDGQIIQTQHPWVVGYPLSPKFQRYGFVSLFLILGFDVFRPFEGANQPKKQHCNWGCGELLDYKGLNNSSIYGISGHSPLLRPRLSGFPKLAAGCIWWWLVWFDRGLTHLLLSDTWLYVFIHSNMARNAAKNALGIFAPFILSPTCNRNRPKPILMSYAQLCCGPQLHLETPPLPRSAAWLEAAALVAPDCISGCICFPFPYPNCHQLRPTGAPVFSDVSGGPPLECYPRIRPVLLCHSNPLSCTESPSSESADSTFSS